MDHSKLPSVANASLPETYEKATHALRKCSKIDECKDWSDKALAMASYAKQANDKELENMARRIRARAVRRCGQLFQEIEKAQGGRPPKTGGTGATSLTRKAAAVSAGLSKDQAVRSIRVANVPEDSFEAQVESDSPPSITNLAEQGTNKRDPPVPEHKQRGIPVESYRGALYFTEALQKACEYLEEYSCQSVVEGINPDRPRNILKSIRQIRKCFNAIEVKLNEHKRD